MCCAIQLHLRESENLNDSKRIYPDSCRDGLTRSIVWSMSRERILLLFISVGFIMGDNGNKFDTKEKMRASASIRLDSDTKEIAAEVFKQ